MAEHLNRENNGTFMIKKIALGLFLAATSAAFATNYAGNGDTGFGGAVGTGSLDVTQAGSNITFTLNRGAGNFNDALVIYIDSAAGGFTSTSGFSDTGPNDGGRKAISGFDGTNRSLMTFAGGFAPESAIVIEDGFASLFTLANGGDGSFTFVTGAAQSGVNNSATYGLTMSLAQLGVTAGSSFELFGTYISTTAFRSTEAIAGNDTGTQGSNPFTQTSFGTFTTTAVPEPATVLLVGPALLGGMFFVRRRRA